MNEEEVDLEQLTAFLKSRLGGGGPEGYLRGKATMRDLLVQERGYSELEAEELVDTLEMNGFLQFLGNPAERSEADAHWALKS